MAAQAQVEIVLAADSVDGDIVGYDKNGKKVDLPHRIVVSPYFFGSMTVANLAYITVKAGAREVARAVVQLAGASGKVKVVDRSQQHPPKFVTAGKAAEEAEEAEEEQLEGEEYEEVEEEVEEELEADEET